MKYLWATLAVLGEIIVYLSLGVAMNWRAGGGILVQFLFFAIFGATWRAITKERKNDDETEIEEEGRTGEDEE